MTSVKGLRRDYSSSEYAASREGEGERDTEGERTLLRLSISGQCSVWRILNRVAGIPASSVKCVIGAWPVCAIVEGGHGQTPRS